MNNNSKSPFDFLSKLEEKGIISSSGSSKKTKKSSGSLGEFFRTVLEELADPDQRSKPSRPERHEEPEQSHSEVYDDEHEETVCDPEEEVDTRREKALKTKRKQEKIVQQQYAKANLSKKIADDKTRSNRIKVEEAEAEDLLRIKNKRSNSKIYTGLLHHDKTGLRQAFVLKEILSKPIGLR